jgi:hypothetical protein
MHSRQLPDRLIHSVATLPPDMNRKSVIALLGSEKMLPEDLAVLGWLAARIRAQRGQHAYVTLLSAANPFKALVELLLDGEFPPSPWSGNRLVRPITSRAELHSIGLAFGNCLGNSYWLAQAVLKILNGTTYFYEWRGEQPALLSFVRLQDLGWFLHEIEGVEHQPIRHSTREQIVWACSHALHMCPFAKPSDSDWNDAGFGELILGSST